MIGQTISHYRILEKLGRGGMGEVYLAEDTQLGRKVAIKFLTADTASNDRARQRLLREAKTAATLDHSNICAIYEVGDEGGVSFIVLQYVAGETLASRIRRHLPDLPESLAIAAQVADALNEAHSRGIVHRDIKPENIMITTRGQVKVLDFGLAKASSDLGIAGADTASMLSLPGMLVGTVPYMSPEQVRCEELDRRSDIFSFGAVLYELLSGRRPFEAKSIAEVVSAILTVDPPPIGRSSLAHSGAGEERLIRKCLEKDAAQRYQTIGDLIPDLQQLRREYESGHVSPAIVTPAPTAAVAVAIPAPTSASANPNPRGLRISRPILAFTLIALALAGAAYLTLLRTRTSAPPSKALSANPVAYDAYMRGR